MNGQEKKGEKKTHASKAEITKKTRQKARFDPKGLNLPRSAKQFLNESSWVQALKTSYIITQQPPPSPTGFSTNITSF